MSFELLYGSASPLPERVPLRAGALNLVLESGDLRSIRLNGTELLNRIYGAIRDAEWATIPGRISDLRVDAGVGRFEVSYLSEHVSTHVDLVWHAEITGETDGIITFAFRGEARQAFARNRIGLCVLHPLTCAGCPATATTGAGGSREVAFPREVAVEQPINGFHDLTGLRWPVAPGVEAELTLEGDIFETEDQRNWIDASFKTYSTPLSWPRPVVIAAGTRIEQRVTLRLLRAGSTVRLVLPADTRALRETPLPVPGGTPRIGLVVGDEPPTSGDLARLQWLHPAHLRVELSLQGQWEPRLAQALEHAAALGCGVELALDVARDSAESLRRLGRMLPDSPSVARILVFETGELATTAIALDAVREHLTARRPDSGPLASGSRQDLYQVHLFDPPCTGITCWGMQPQAHATDLTSIAETPAAVGHQVRAVKARRPGAVAISPIHLHRSAPDPRQRSLFAAAWTLVVLAELYAAGAESVTLFELTGARGVMTDAVVFPVFHVLADLAALSDGPAVAAILHPLEEVTGLLLSGSLLLANLSRESRTVPLPPQFRPRAGRILDESSVVDAMRAPEQFRGRTQEPPTGAFVTLAPFATARLDGERG